MWRNCSGRIPTAEGYQVVDRPHGHVLRSVGDRPDGRGFGAALTKKGTGTCLCCVHARQLLDLPIHDAFSVSGNGTSISRTGSPHFLKQCSDVPAPVISAAVQDHFLADDFGLGWTGGDPLL